MDNREEYTAVEGAEESLEVERQTRNARVLLEAVQWPRVAGLFASMNSPAPRPPDADAWRTFFTTTRNRPLLHNWASNLKAGATVACVNVPLSISLALASGGTPTQGMVCAFWASLCTGLFGSSHFNVVGTTSALSGMLDKLATHYGEAVLPTVSVYSAIFLFIFWALRVDRAMKYVATPVAQGFAVGVGVMIGLGQLSAAFAIRGLPPADGFLNKFFQFLANLDRASPTDAALYIASSAALFYVALRWKQVPWVLVLALVGIGLGMTSAKLAPSSTTPSTNGGALAHGKRTTAAAVPAVTPHRPPVYLLREKYPDIEMFFVIPDTHLPTWLPIIGSTPGLNHCEGNGHDRTCVPEGPELWQYQPDVIFYAFGCAVVSLLETLISAQIANRLFKGVATDYDVLARAYSSTRESLALSFTALVCGIVGSICPAAALARTSLNVKSGAFSRISGLINAVILGIIAFVMLPYFEYLPFAFVGSILLLVAYRLVEFDELAKIRRGDPAGMYLCIMTGVVCVFMDTFVGLIVGVVTSLAMNWRVLQTLPVTVDIDDHKFVRGGVHAAVAIKAAVTFANVNSADETLEAVLVDLIHAEEKYYSVHLDLLSCEEMDFDGVEALDEWGRKVRLSGAKLTIDRGVHLTRILHVAHNLNVHGEEKTVVPTPHSDVKLHAHR
jgi:SulP family sulfate permease